MPEIHVTLDVTAQSEEMLERHCVKFLTERGFNVTPPNEKWEKVSEFIERVGICYQTLARKLRPKRERPNVAVQYGNGTVKRRVIAILSNKDFDAYCVQNK